MQSEQATQQSIGWLVSGLVLGLLGVLASVITPSWEGAGDSGVVAVVNDTAITRAKYLSYLEALATDKKDPIGTEDSQYVLQRIIEEELLVQRGVEVGLLESDKRTRAALVNGMISMTTTAAEARAPSEKELAEFFQENIDYFTPTARLRARQLVVRGEDAEQRAGEAYRLLVAGERFQTVESEFGTPVALIVPDSLLPPAKLREYLGPTLTQMLLEQPAGFVTEPQPMTKGFRIVLLLDKEVGQAPALGDVRQQLEAEYVRRSGDRALREYLEWLKDRADISYPSELPL
ncbi:MAG: peptidyl-prolyl cis-trans isomerase [Proteobacteria bacterium]|nr:peptidyl-prolyl cis-trans isomerase [Pseudomonadota bacterium]